MRHALIVAAIAGLCGAEPLSAQAPDTARTLGVTLISLGVGLRDAGEYGTMTVVALAVRRQVSRTYAVTAGVVESWRKGELCIGTAAGGCDEIGDAAFTTIEAGVEYPFFGELPLYALASLGLSYSHDATGRNDGWGGSYSTGVGIRLSLSRRTAAFLEGRWREERFSSRSTGGVGALAGVAFHW